MRNRLPYEEARDLLLQEAGSVSPERVPLAEAAFRVLAEDIRAPRSVPPFDSSPYDGYALRAEDSRSAGADHPVTLRILEEIPAGSAPGRSVTEGTASKVLTGAPIPPGADAVIMYEKTHFTPGTVTLFSPISPGSNIIRAGEDIRQGSLLAADGSPIDAGTLGTLASQGFETLRVYRRPRVGIISTGSELTEPGAEPGPGKIYNSNRYTFTALLSGLGCEPVYLGTAGDETDSIAALLREGLRSCDALLLTGGVSAGDYDLTPAAMEAVGTRMLFRGVDLKPGMACAYGVRDGKLICALSGSPASSVTNFHAIAAPALRKLCGLRACLPREIRVTLLEGFSKPSPVTRLLRGSLELGGGTVCLRFSREQGNVVLSSTIGNSAMAVIPAGSGPISSGTTLKGFMI